ncbi:MAG: hypothetical protein LBC51_00015 [Treponema sp.]|nr:hypothetical protein [Treponema sp.]
MAAIGAEILSDDILQEGRAACGSGCYPMDPCSYTLPHDLVYAAGEINLHPNVHRAIPDQLDFSLDVRH